jgi:hypothetical protein
LLYFVYNISNYVTLAIGLTFCVTIFLPITFAPYVSSFSFFLSSFTCFL